MLTKYQMKVPSCVHAGVGTLAGIPAILEKEGVRKLALFTDAGLVASGLADAVSASFTVPFVTVADIPSEPDYHQVQALADSIRDEGVDFIIALGGGSVMDAAKLASVLVGAPYSVKDLLKNPSTARKIVKTLMIPTTCGTGSEATCNAIVLVPEEELKVGIVNDEMIGDYVILDPATVRNLPKKIAASTALDALCHAIECYTGAKANAFSDMFALEAMRLIFPSIIDGVCDPEAVDAKMDLLLAAFYAGCAITSSGTTAIHALSYPLGGRYHIPHGVANAMLLSPVMAFNCSSCKERLAVVCDSCRLSSAEGLDDKAAAVIRRLEEIVEELGIPRLGDYGIGEGDLASLATAGLDVKRLMDNNPRPMSHEEAVAIYREAL